MIFKSLNKTVCYDCMFIKSNMCFVIIAKRKEFKQSCYWNKWNNLQFEKKIKIIIFLLVLYLARFEFINSPHKKISFLTQFSRKMSIFSNEINLKLKSWLQCVSYRCIAFPLDGRLSMKQALMLVLFTWLYALPFSILPFNNTWGRYVAGKSPTSTVPSVQKNGLTSTYIQSKRKYLDSSL